MFISAVVFSHSVFSSSVVSVPLTGTVSVLFSVYIDRWCFCRAWLIDSRTIARKVRNPARASVYQIKGYGANCECPNCHHFIDNGDVSYNCHLLFMVLSFQDDLSFLCAKSFSLILLLSMSKLILQCIMELWLAQILWCIFTVLCNVSFGIFIFRFLMIGLDFLLV